jgi:hypothetical protein
LTPTRDIDSAAPLFDAVCRIARDLFAVPRALICLGDGSYHGDGPGPEAELITALGELWPCPQTVLLVEDARSLIAAPVGIGFLAAAPILGKTGLPAGVLCMSDSRGRSIDDEDR